MLGKVVSVLKKENHFVVNQTSFSVWWWPFLKTKSKFKFGHKIKLTGDITSTFGKIKDETGTYNLTEGMSFGKQIICMTFFLDFCDILNDYGSLNICRMNN